MSDADRPGGQPDPRGPQYQPGQGQGPHPQQPPQPPVNPYGGPGQPGPPQPGQPNPGPQPGQPNPYGNPQAYGATSGQGYNPIPGQPAGPPNPYGQPQPYGVPGPSPYGPSAGAPGGGGGAKKSKLPLILIGAGVAFLLVVGLVIAALTGGEDEPVADDPVTTSAPEATKPSDAVQGYLDALAANDAATALGFLDEQPSDTTFLTDAVLQSSAKEGGITDISVPEVTDKYAYRVNASYKLGEQSVTEDFSVTESGGSYKISRGVSEFDLSYQRDETLPMLINGIEVTTDKVSLFPGNYAFTTDSKWVTYDDASLVLTGPSDYDTPRLTPELNAAGKKAFLAQAEKALDTCLDQRKLAPSGCPNRLNLRSGQKVDQSTIRWTLTNDPFKNAKVTLDSTDPSVAEARFYPEYNFKAKGSVDGSSVTFDGPPIGLYAFGATGDLSGDEVKVKLSSR